MHLVSRSKNSAPCPSSPPEIAAAAIHQLVADATSPFASHHEKLGAPRRASRADENRPSGPLLHNRQLLRARNRKQVRKSAEAKAQRDRVWFLALDQKMANGLSIMRVFVRPLAQSCALPEASLHGFGVNGWVGFSGGSGHLFFL
jgi:hypothetical protein